MTDMKTNLFPKDKPMPVTSRIGDVIRKHREALGMSQEGLALAAGISPLAVHLIETHQRYPKMDTAERLSTALDIPLPALVMEAAVTA